MNMKRSPLSMSSALWVSVAAMGCTGDRSSVSTVTTVDPTGVEIVDNSGRPSLDGGGWSVSTDPILTIGTVEGEEALQFFGVAGLHRFPDGRIAVVNAGSREVRIFDPSGAHIRSLGQQGGGPEEFEMPILAGYVGDTLLVVDRAHHRLSLLHPDLGFLGLARISDEVGGFLNPVGGFADGQTVYGGAFDMRRIGELKNGLNRAHTFYRSSNLDGSLATDFGDRYGADFYIKDLEGDGQDSRPAIIPFGRAPTASTSPHFFFFSDQSDFDIEVFEPSGKTVRRIRLDWEPIPVTEADGELYLAEMVEQAGSPEQAAQLRAYLGAIPLPEFFPPHGAILGDRLDYLWVAEFQRPGSENQIMNIFHSDGALVGRVTLPENFYPAEIGEDYLLGVGRDELNVEYVRIYSLHRGE